MKAYYYLAEAQMALNHPNEALTSALTAYEFCIRSGNASASSISALILKAKKAKWEARERERLRRQNELLKELEDRLEYGRLEERRAIESDVHSGRMDWTQRADEIDIVEESYKRKIEELHSIFAAAHPSLMAKRVNSTLLTSHDPAQH